MSPHQRRSRRRTWVIAAIAPVACALAVASAAGFDPDSDYARSRVTILPPAAPGAGATTISVQSAAASRAIPPGFVGLSLEYNAIWPYAGTNPRAIDPVLVELIRSLAPGQRPVLRIGGDSTDWAWWPVPGMGKPAGVRIDLGPRFGAVLQALTRALDARLILGIDLEADSRRLATFEAAQLIRSVGPRAVQTLELGNEPELYGSWPWRAQAGHPRVMARARDYGVASYVQDLRRISTGLPGGLAGPALGGPKWIGRLGEVIASVPRLRLVTVHTYPLQQCYTPLVSVTYPTIGHLLASRASQGLADGLAAAIRTAHAHGLPIRVDEINSVSCGGAPGVSDTFASALWALDTMFAMARAGVDGVNIHTFESATYRLFRMTFRDGGWRGALAPEYYGLLLFARAVPPGSYLLHVSGGDSMLRAWATRAPDGTVHIVLINDDPAHGRVAVVRPPGAAPEAAYEALRAPDLRSTRRVSLGGASFGAFTATGILPPPVRVVARPRGGAYVLRLPPSSAVMLTLPSGSAG